MEGTTRTFEPQKIIQPIYTGGDVSLDSTGRILASCLGEDALLTDLQSGELLGRIEGDGESLTALRLTPSASHLVACSRSLSMRIYSLEQVEGSNALEATLLCSLKPHNAPVVTATIDETGSILATGGADGSIKVWDIRGGYASHTFRGHSGVISALAFFSDVLTPELPKSSKKKKRKSQSQEEDEDGPASGSKKFYLASGGEDGKVQVWDLMSRKKLASLDSHVSVVRGLAYSTEQKALVSGSRDRTIIIWDAQTWRAKRTIPVLEVLETTGFIGDGKYAYTGGESGRLRVWEIETGREVTKEKPTGNEGDGILQILHAADLPLLLSVHVDQSLVLRSTDSLSTLDSDAHIESLPLIRRISGTHDEIIDMAFVSANGSMMALATNSESVRLVSIPTNTEDEMDTGESQYFGADIGLLQGHDEIIICLDVDWSGCWLATGAKDNTARLWRIDKANNRFESFATLTGHAESIGAIALPKTPPQPDSAAFSDPVSHPPAFLITGSQDKTIKRWNISPTTSSQKGSRAIFTKKAHDKDINAIDINHTSTLFASASQDKLVKIWSTEEGETQGVLRGHKRGVWSVKFSPKDSPVIASDSGLAKASRGFALTGSGDKTVKIWSLADYSCLRTLEGHTNSVLKVLWLQEPQPDDEQQQKRKQKGLVASAGGDGLVKVWDASSGECAATLDNHEDRVWALASSPSNGNIVSGGGDGVITFWADTTAATAAAATAASSERIEQEQMLQNHVRHGNYREAITLALQLNHPARLLALFSDVVKKYPAEEGSLSGLKAVDEVLESLSDDQLYTLLLRVRDWNTNARTAPVAQRILWVIVKSYPASHLVGLRKNGRGLGNVLDGLKAYTERHYKRIEELVEESYLVDFMVRSMEEGGFVSEMGGAIENGKAVNGLAEGADVVMVE